MTRDFVRWFGATPAVLRRDHGLLGTLDQPGLGNWAGEQISIRQPFGSLTYDVVWPHGSRIRVSVACQRDDVTIAVADEGFGIPAAELRHVFDQFVRGSNTNGPRHPRNGLGLAIVSHIVAAHQGRVDLHSEEGRGSTFTIVLPAAAVSLCRRSHDPYPDRRRRP